MIRFYDWFFSLARPFIIFWGKLHYPFTHKLINGEDYYRLRSKIEIGTVLLTKTRGELSNIINPAKMKHAGIFVGRMKEEEIFYVMEATAEGVVFTDLVTFMTTKDEIVICKPNFIRDKADFNTKVQKLALKLKGIPYDYLFNPDGTAFYCFELAAITFRNVYSEVQLQCNEIIKGKRIYNEKTFLDKDFFEVVYDSRKK